MMSSHALAIMMMSSRALGTVVVYSVHVTNRNDMTTELTPALLQWC